MREITTDRELVAFCGLYCGACGAYLREKCPGCRGNEKASWCKVRSCCLAAGYTSCADCGDFADPGQCRKFNNFLSRIFGLILRSDRRACVMQIKELGPEGHAREMVRRRRQTLRPGERS